MYGFDDFGNFSKSSQAKDRDSLKNPFSDFDVSKENIQNLTKEK